MKASDTEIYSCFKCKADLTGICGALEIGGKFTFCLKCLYGFAIVYDAEEVQYLDEDRGWWTNHTRDGKEKGRYYSTSPRTMMEDQKYKDKRGSIPKKARYCNTCQKDCGLGQKDLVLFYCDELWKGKYELHLMQCNECFTKEVPKWFVPNALTATSGTVNRKVPQVRLYSHPDVIKADIWNDDCDEEN